MDIQEFSQENLLRCESAQGFKHSLHSWSTSEWLIAVMGELGEVANIVKKLNRARDGVSVNDETWDELRQQLQNEIADTFIYLDLLAQSQGMDLSTSVIEVFNTKSTKIGYPRVLR